MLPHARGRRAAALGRGGGWAGLLGVMGRGGARARRPGENRHFHQAGVATEWMTFTDHPDESLDEALATASWIEEQHEVVDCFIVGKFGLERGSHIAQDPQRYGVRRIHYAQRDDLHLHPLYTHVR